MENLVKRSEQVGAFPHLGRMVPEYEISEVRQVIESSYRLIYLIKEEQIEVLAIIHTLVVDYRKKNSCMA